MLRLLRQMQCELQGELDDGNATLSAGSGGDRTVSDLRAGAFMSQFDGTKQVLFRPSARMSEGGDETRNMESRRSLSALHQDRPRCGSLRRLGLVSV